MLNFYQQRAFAPAWTEGAGAGSNAIAALRLLHDADEQGPSAASYPVTPAPRRDDAGARIAFELSLTKALLHFSHDLHLGHTDAVAVYSVQAVSLAPRTVPRINENDPIMFDRHMMTWGGWDRVAPAWNYAWMLYRSAPPGY